MAGRTMGAGARGSGVIGDTTTVDVRDDEGTLVSVDFRRLVGALRPHLWLVFLVAAIVTAAVGFYLYRQQPRYRASAIIRLVDRRRALTAGMVDAKAAETQAERTTSPLLSQIQVLLSRQVASLVVDSTEALGLRLRIGDLPAGTLRDVVLDPASPLDSVQLRFVGNSVVAKGWSTTPDSVYGGRATLGAPLHLAGLVMTISRAPAQQPAMLYVISRADAADMLLRDLSAKPREETDVIDVHYESVDNRGAQRVVNTVVHVFMDLNARAANQQASQRRAFVEDQLRQNDSIVSELEGLVSAAAAARERGTPGRELSAGEQVALTTLQARQQELRADAVLYRNLIGQLSQTTASRRMEVLRSMVSSPGLAGNTIISQMYQQLSGYRYARDSLLSGPYASAESNPDVRRYESLISASEAGLIEALRNYSTSVDARLAALDTITSTMRPRQISEPEAREAGLMAQLEALRKSGDALREQRQQARIAAAAEVGEVEIIDEATLPTVPIGRSRTLKLLLGMLVGLAVGAVVALMVEAVDNLNTSIRRNSDIEKQLQVPALGIIPPRLGPPVSRLRRLFTRKPKNAQPESELIAADLPHSAPAEAYRALRTNLLFSQAVHELRSIVVTSATPGDGKTTTAANLATVFAQQGVRVLLVDCDLRRPRVHAIMSTRREPGLTQVLLGQATLADAVHDGRVPNLSALSAGRLPPNPSELLGGSRMKAVLQDAMSKFDLVILDSPPVLLTPDSSVLGAVCDGVLLVLRAGSTQIATARETLRQLNIVEAHVIGAVLNDPDYKVPLYDRQYAYGYGGGYYAPANTPANVPAQA